MVLSMKSAISIYILVAVSSLFMAAYQPAHPVGARAKPASHQAAQAVRSSAEKLWCLAMANLATVNGLHP